MKMVIIYTSYEFRKKSQKGVSLAPAFELRISSKKGVLFSSTHFAA